MIDPPTDKASILLVGDDSASVLALKAILEPLGQTLMAVHTRDELLQRVDEQDFAVILLDVQLRGMDGLVTARRIREKDRARPIPIIFMTASERSGLPVVEAYKLGAVDYLIKPLVPEILQAKAAGFVELFKKNQLIERQARALAATERRERLRIEAALRDSEERHRLWVQAVKDFAIFLMDAEGLVTSWNEGGERLIGYSMEEIIGKHFRIFFLHDDRRDQRPERELAAAAAKGSASDENWIQRKDGSRFWASGFTTGLREDDGKLRGFVKICRDLTERKEFEDALRQHALDLKEAARRNDEFLAMLSHELRNPLVPIRNAVEILRQGGGDEAILAWVKEVMERQIRHMTRLIDDLLDVTRLGQGKLSLRRESVDLVRLLRSAVDLHTPAFRRSNLVLSSEIPAEPIWVMADPARLSQVIDNLLDNANKFSDPGGQVTIHLESDQRSGKARLSIRDTGIGIPAEMLPNIFDLFQQAEQGLARSRGGLGVGLALVKKLVEMHGGEVRAQSAGAGAGAEFSFDIPLAPVAGGGAAPSAAPVSMRPLKILIIEDNKDAAETLRLLLAGAGHQAFAVQTGAAGIEWARQNAPNAVLCDLGLPGMDGFRVAQALRKEHRAADLHLIAVSGYGTEADQEKARQAGFDLHLTKPVDPKDLFEALATFRLR